MKVRAQDLIEFSDGLVGFPGMARYFLLSVPDGEDTCLRPQFLQSADAPALAFVVCDPDRFQPGFSRLALADEAVRAGAFAHGVELSADAIVRVVLNVSGGVLCANLRGPVVINPKSGRGSQFVTAAEFSTMHAIPG